ncbi:ATP-binding cassette domain-containing protein [Streptomyces samsunensis]|nr:ATP-binding cassette domain-containing protein [Streptomyces samsunensis]
MRLRSDLHAQASAAMTLWDMTARLPRTLVTALRLAWRTDRNAVVLWAIGQALGAVATAVVLAATSSVLGRFTSGSMTSRDELVARLGDAVPSGVVLACCLVGRSMLGALAEAAAARLAPKVNRVADEEVLSAAAGVDLAAYESPGFEDSLEAAGQGAEATRDLMLAAQSLIAATGSLVGVSGYLAVLHPVLLPLLLLAAVPQGYAAVKAAQVEHAAVHRMLSDERLRSVWRSYATGRNSAGEVRGFTMAAFLIGRYREVSARLEREDLAAVHHALRLRLAGAACAALALCVVWAAVIGLAVAGHMAIAAAGTALIGARACAMAATGWAQAGAKLFRSALYLDDWTRFLGLAAAHQAQQGAAAAPLNGPGLIRTRGLVFSYPGAESPALDGIDLELRRGEVVALIGENGSGKTTLARLLTGLYRPTAGHVEWDGRELSDLAPETVWRSVGMVPQHYTRWPMSARENITLGQPHAGGDPVVDVAAAAAGADEVIDRLPCGLDTLLARSWWGGHDLSGGQWQRLAVARAFYRDAPVLVLDEPTAALDARAEHRIFERLRYLAGGRTTIFVTHRLVNARLADRIIVLEKGRVAEEGAFPSLVTAGGLFQQLYDLQHAGAVSEAAAGQKATS